MSLFQFNVNHAQEHEFECCCCCCSNQNNQNNNQQRTILETDTAPDVTNDSSTSATMAVGDTFNGSLTPTGDRDWIAIDLTAGQDYQIDLIGIGSNGVSDTYLRVYDQNGNLIAFDDDGGAGYFSQLTLNASQSQTYFIEVDSYANRGSGDYQLQVISAAPASPTEALVWNNAAFDNSQSIQVYFAMAGSTVNNNGTLITSDGFSQTDLTTIMNIFNSVSNFANIQFTQTFNQSSADIQMATSNLDGGLLGYMYPQGSSLISSGLGVLTSNSSYNNSESMQYGGFMHAVTVHEIGHGLGLAHPHDTGGGSQVMRGVSNSSDTGDYGNMNQSVYTIMSYNDSWDNHPLGASNTYSSGHMATFAALDISVLQSYYGTNDNYNNTDNTYYLGRDSYYETIWDTGGTDEFVVDSNANALINLQAATLAYEVGGAGNVSYTNDIRGGLTIAANVVIENATGGSGNDILIGNEVSNILQGNAGNDTLSGGGNDDILMGGAGADTFILQTGDGIDIITDFSLTQDTLTFLNIAGQAIDLSNIDTSRSDEGGRQYNIDESSAFVLSNILNFAPTGSVTLNGESAPNNLLTATISTISDADGVGALNYQWFRDGTSINNATSTQYQTSQADSGTTITFAVSYTDGFGITETLMSSNQIEIDLVNSAPSGTPVITGTATEGQTLNVDTSGISDTDGLGNFSYQWLADGNAINGATNASFTLGQSEVGSEISVIVNYTDGGGNNESLSSGVTDIVTPLPDTSGTEIGDAASDSSTTAAMGSNNTFTGSLQTRGDRDWIAVQFAENTINQIQLSGDGSTPVRDTYLRLYDGNGILLARDDDSGPGYYSALTFVAESAGTYYIEADSYRSFYTGDYQIQVASQDLPDPTPGTETVDAANNAGTTAVIGDNGTFTGSLQTRGDRDWIAIEMTANTNYQINLAGEGTTPVRDTYLRLYDGNGRLLARDDDSGPGRNSSIVYTTQNDGTYFIEADSYRSYYTGDYRITVESTEITDGISNDVLTIASMAIGEQFTGQLDRRGDQDWIAITLTEGQTYQINLNGYGNNPVYDPYLRLYDMHGDFLRANDDGGPGINSAIRYTANESGIFYIEADSYRSYYSGEYQIAVTSLSNNNIEASALSIRGNNRANTLEGDEQNDYINARGGHDVITAMGGNDNVRAGNGNDYIDSGLGDDMVYAGRGGDTVIGNLGADRLYLGGRNDLDTDTVVYITHRDSLVGNGQRDRIYQFDQGEDLIDLSAIDANIHQQDNQDFLFNQMQAANNAIWIVDNGNHLVVNGDINGDSVADFEIEIRNINSLDEDDFIL